MACLPLVADAQITITSGVQKYASLAGTTVNMSGRCELWVTNSSTPLSGCIVNLNSVDAWLFLPGIKPSVVASTYLGQVRVNGTGAFADNNVRVVQYGQNGAVVIPQPPTFQPLTVFSEPQFGGAATAYGQWTYYTGGGIGSFSSFRLKRGYQVVFAQSADGKYFSKCYVAQDGDLEIGVLPATLDKQVQFIYVTPWRWTSKKGIASDPGIPLLNLVWWYNWNINSSSSRDLEYVAIRQNQYWPGLGQDWQSLGINTVLGYNEPDQANQANLSVSTAISAWGDLLGTGLRVGSPATSDGGPSGWLFPFIQQADAAGLRVDFVAQHYYQAHNPADSAGCASQMYNFLLNIWNNTHRPIWVTEWNNGANWTDNNPWPAPTYDQQQACIAAMVQMLENTPFVERYALYNWVEDPRAVTTNGVLTGAGVVYSNQVSNLAYSQAMPDNGTHGIAQYLFATNTLDTSGYGNNGMGVGAPAYAAGHNNQVPAVVLDGVNSYLQLPANIAKAGAFTFAAWVYWNGGGNWQRIFDFGNDTSHYLFLTPSSGGGTLRFAINNGGGEQIVEQPGALASASWQHVAITLNGNSAILYVNGAPAASSTGSSIAPSAFSPIKNYLGKSQFAADPLFSGKLDEVEIADYAMTAAQISALYNNVPSPPPPYASGVWTNDASGNWGVSNNWNGGVIASGGKGVNYSADFSTLNIAADRTVTLDTNRGIGGLRFGDPAGSQNWTLAGGGILTLNSISTNAPAIIVNQNNSTISAPLAGTYGFAKSGSGTLVLSNPASPSGTVFIDSASSSASDGSVRASSPGSLASTTAIQIRNNNSGSSTLQLDGTAGVVSVPDISLNGRNNPVPAIENIAGTNSLVGRIALNAGGGSYLVQADAGVLNLAGTITNATGGARTLTFQGSGNMNLLGAVTDGNGTTRIVKNGSGTLFLNGSSTYSGGTTVNQGTLALQPAPPTPILHLTFDNAVGGGNGTFITNAGLGGPAMNGTMVGSGATIASGGRFGNALNLNGVGGTSATNIVLINNRVMNTDASGNWTVGYWIKTGTAGAVVLYQGDGTWTSAGQTTFLLNANSGSIAGASAGAVRWAGGFLTGTAALNNGAWHFVTLVDNTGTETIYVDGDVDAVTSTMANPLAGGANQIWIGGSPDYDSGAVKMNGLIDEVFMFNRALSQAEVRSLYYNNIVTNVPTNVLPPGAPVNIAAGGILDLAGNAQTLTALSGSGLLTNSGVPATLTFSNAGGTASFAGAIGDDSPGNALNLTKLGIGTFVLAGANTYHGNTAVNGGTLLVNGSIGPGAVTVAAGTLGGNGVIGGAITVQSGGTLSPGSSIGVLTANNNVTLQSGSATVMEVGNSPQTNDQLVVTGTLTFGGTLVIANLSGTFTAGDSFQLFQAGSIKGLFSSNSLPALNAGLAWNTSVLSNGLISVVQTVPTNLAWAVSGTNINLSWPAGYTGWGLQIQANAIDAGLDTNWVDVPGSTLTNSMVMPMNPGNGSVYYRLIY